MHWPAATICSREAINSLCTTISTRTTRTIRWRKSILWTRPRQRCRSSRSTMLPSNRFRSFQTERHTHATIGRQPAIWRQRKFDLTKHFRRYRPLVTRASFCYRCNAEPAKTVQIRYVRKRNDQIIIFQNQVLFWTKYSAAVNSPACTRASWNVIHRAEVHRVRPKFLSPSKRCTTNIAKRIVQNSCEKPVSWSNCLIIVSSNWSAFRRFATRTQWQWTLNILMWFALIYRVRRWWLYRNWLDWARYSIICLKTVKRSIQTSN